MQKKYKKIWSIQKKAVPLHAFSPGWSIIVRNFHSKMGE